MLKLVSWNINGLRAIHRKGFLEMFEALDCDILCLQEIKAEADQLPKALRDVPGYHAYFNSCETRKGYSGTAMYTRVEPEKITTGFGEERFDNEGRIQLARFDRFDLYNIYYPNGGTGDTRLQYKLDFYEAFQKHAEALREAGRSLVICGDVNTAHKPIDLARPEANTKTSGFMPVERAWIDRFLDAGYLDTFRLFDPEGQNYSWWDYKTKARERNVGWRIDYFFTTPDLRPYIVDAAILPQYYGSDHCPISLTLNFNL